jgi:DNA topoisomerase-1
VKKIKTDVKKGGKKKRARSESESDDEYDSDYSDKVRSKKKAKASTSRKSTASTSSRKSTSSSQSSPTKKGGRKAKEEEPEEVWEWWKEAPREDGVKWNFLQHKGPVFAPEYEPLPKDVKFRYNGKSVKLSRNAEEVAGFYSRFIEHDYTTKEMFNKNFFKVRPRELTLNEINRF